MIHKTAIVDSKAKIFENVEIGPYSIIGPEVEIGPNTLYTLMSILLEIQR